MLKACNFKVRLNWVFLEMRSRAQKVVSFIKTKILTCKKSVCVFNADILFNTYTSRISPLLFMFLLVELPAASRDCSARGRHSRGVRDRHGEPKAYSLNSALAMINFSFLFFPQVHKAQDTATKRGKLLTEDFLFLIRKVHCCFFGAALTIFAVKI